MISYSTRPIRNGERDGVEYFFVSTDKLEELINEDKIIEIRQYNTVQGLWSYFTVNDGQIDLNNYNSLIIGTLESYEQIRNYFGKENIYPIYVEVDNGLRLQRALDREKSQETPQYTEMCRRYLADEEDFSEENLRRLGICKRYQNNDLDKCTEQIIKDIKTIKDA